MIAIYYPPYTYYQPPVADQLTQLRQNQYVQPQSSPVIWVQGEAAARAYMVAAGNTVLLMDSESSVFYLKSTDASGMPQPLRIFDYQERTGQKPAEYVTREEFNQLSARLDAITQGAIESEQSTV